MSRRQPIVDAIVAAVRQCGAQILSMPDPAQAPFEMRILTPQGESIRLVLYAFLANRYAQANRPPDEHRFQVKYGSDFESYHQIYIADGSEEVTLMFGVHLDRGLFIAVDPSMHEWTRFSRSVEFKEADLDEAESTGWHGWERDRSPVRRIRAAPRDDLRTESLLAFRPENFLRYVAFERIATGMDTGERLLWAERMGHGVSTPESRHPLEAELGLDAHQILDMIGGAFRLKAAVRGSTAEHHLRTYLESLPDLNDVRQIDEDGQPDFEVHLGGSEFLIECKNVLRRRTRSGACRVDFQKTRASKGDPCSRYYRPEQFDVLAACLHSVTETWEFRFASTSTLPPHRTCPGHLSSGVEVEGPSWTDSLLDLLT